MRSDFIRQAQRVVLKMGSSIVTSRQGGLNLERIGALAGAVGHLLAEGRQVVLVSSGAVASGLEPLGMRQRPQTIALKQAAAAVGQSRLMWSYERAFHPYDLKVAQILLTHDDLSDRQRFLNARNTVVELLSRGVVPVINENDTVAVEEIRFGDNDTLAGLVAHLIDAQLLVILSDVDGLFTGDPNQDDSARHLPFVESVTPGIEQLAGGSRSPDAVGGMLTKVLAAKQAGAYGIGTVVVNGHQKKVLERLFQGEELGTFFQPRPTQTNSRKHWIAYTCRSKGRLILDTGAVQAVLQKGKSLLPKGILNVDGQFHRGDAVACLDEKGKELARGLVNYSADEIEKIRGGHTTEIEKRLGYKLSEEVIHRDNLLITCET